MSQPTDPTKLEQGRLALCPNSPNCVSSQAEPGDAVHYIEALPASGDAKATIAALRADPEAGVVQVCLASRVGYGDLGANRKRVESLREALSRR